MNQRERQTRCGFIAYHLVHLHKGLTTYHLGAGPGTFEASVTGPAFHNQDQGRTWLLAHRRRQKRTGFAEPFGQSSHLEREVGSAEARRYSCSQIGRRS